MLIRRAGLAVGVTLLAVIGSPAVAAGAPPVECAKKDSLTGVCLIVASTTGADDGPAPTGQRFCNNGIAVTFVPDGEPLPPLRG